MEIIQRHEARARGLTHYYSGRPCKRSHLSKRRVDSSTCLQCDNERSLARAGDPRRKEIARNYANKKRGKVYAPDIRATKTRESRRYLNRHRVRMREQHRKYMGLPEATRPAPATCECCGKPCKRALSLDHCHETGEFRGWLCRKCNSAIGMLGDNVEGVTLALYYLVVRR